MYQKSILQQINERRTAVSLLKNHIKNIQEKYTINGTVFGLVNNTPSEVTSGYFFEGDHFDNLDDAMAELNKGQFNYVRIVDASYTVGSIGAHLSECVDDNIIIDIKDNYVINR